jgi:hypothetical protein
MKKIQRLTSTAALAMFKSYRRSHLVTQLLLREDDHGLGIEPQCNSIPDLSFPRRRVVLHGMHHDVVGET